MVSSAELMVQLCLFCIYMFILFSEKEDKINIPDPPTRMNNYNNFEDAMELYAIPDVAAHYEVVRTSAQSYALHSLHMLRI